MPGWLSGLVVPRLLWRCKVKITPGQLLGNTLGYLIVALGWALIIWIYVKGMDKGF